RLQLSPDFSLTVRELTLQDSGVYRRTGLKAAGGQIPTHTIHLSVYEKITAVQIKSDLTWMPVNETCEVHVMCSSSGDQSASYTWRKGDQTVRGRELHFSLSPAEGGVTVTCTVHNGVSEKSTNDTVMCTFAVLNVNLSGKATLKIIQTYAPTSASDDDEVEEFYRQLDMMLARKSTYTVVMGDFNAKVGKGRQGERGDANYEYYNIIQST
ncbi:uncharacterized protein LOC108930132, partial [Scleropages formosus]|uniref:uncharacterized protein LOC108930132 n=1 Tax=Scleropages formosus TaxID=113540 RepID=UPI0010FAB469